MSSVSGSTESQRILTPETGGHLHLSMGDTPPQEGLASRVSGYPESSQRCHLWNQETRGSGDQGQESQELVKSSGRAWEDGLFPHSLLWRLPVWDNWSVEDLVSLLKM